MDAAVFLLYFPLNIKSKISIKFDTFIFKCIIMRDENGKLNI